MCPFLAWYMKGHMKGYERVKSAQRLKNKKRLSALMNGEYRAPSISEARIEGLFDRLYEENPTEAARVEDEFDTAVEIFEDLRFDLEAIELGEGIDTTHVVNEGHLQAHQRHVFRILGGEPLGLAREQML